MTPLLYTRQLADGEQGFVHPGTGALWVTVGGGRVLIMYTSCALLVPMVSEALDMDWLGDRLQHTIVSVGGRGGVI
jgi:hypothetical protein